MKLDLNQLTIQVRDVEASIAFYQKLGLILIVKSLPEYARFVCHGRQTTFSLHRAGPSEASKSTWIYFETQDLDHDVQRLLDRGLEFEELPTDQPWLWREARLKDPDGHQLILYFAGNNRLHPPWRIHEAL
ncbi:hypothetical protein GCM10027275_35120 [Rhabdobacter roseus]|uniref:Catechol 2,3-dioxygenase-like lactoylglutathione lyase family enzyme n=1 Tax=Rhabdobacter roseus TaxID=1655419 RepID=A0A840TUC1_9BACT|nr:VOC family protein [Rhabdobacter roseus]MBB5285267.1 catechol 2,3-dioxygenase-like lactoylglutathione lyase family enzyme [Rhabdobacter roseus]